MRIRERRLLHATGKDCQKIMSHWQDVEWWSAGDRIVVGTDAGELLLVDTSDLKTTLHFPVAEEKATVIVAQGKVLLLQFLKS